MACCEFDCVCCFGLLYCRVGLFRCLDGDWVGLAPLGVDWLFRLGVCFDEHFVLVLRVYFYVMVITLLFIVGYLVDVWFVSGLAIGCFDLCYFVFWSWVVFLLSGLDLGVGVLCLIVYVGWLFDLFFGSFRVDSLGWSFICWFSWVFRLFTLYWLYLLWLCLVAGLVCEFAGRLLALGAFRVKFVCGCWMMCGL